MSFLSEIVFPEEKMYHADPQRFRRSTIAGIIVEAFLLTVSLLLLSAMRSSSIWPIDSLIVLIFIGVVISISGLIGVFISRNVRKIVGLKAIGYSILFIPTLVFTGGFISPFVIVYLLTTLLATAMIDVIPRKIGQMGIVLLVGSYVTVSLLQKAGHIPSYVSYVEPLLQNSLFFWTVFSITLICFIGGFFILGTTSRNVRDTVNQMVNIHRHVAEGTAGYTGKAFFNQLITSLCEAMEVESAFLLEWYGGERNNGAKARVFTCRNGETMEETIEITESVRRVVQVEEKKPRVFAVENLPGVFEKIAAYPLRKSFGYCIPLVLSDKTPVGLLAVAHQRRLSADPIVNDILAVFAARAATELERIEAERKELHMQNMLAQGQKMHAIGQLAGGLTHDFNNYINGIMGFAYLIKKKSPKDSPCYTYAEKIHSISTMAGGLTTQLLSFSRRSKPESGMVDVHEMIENMVVILKHTLPRNIEIVKQLESEEKIISGDLSNLQSAILNCALNSRDAMKDGGVLRIKTSCETVEEDKKFCRASGKAIEPGSYLVVSLSDTGSGIPFDVMNRLFEPFYTTKKAKEGTGLGLAQVYGCVENHKGAILVDSKEGEGASFHIYLPLACRGESNGDTGDGVAQNRRGPDIARAHPSAATSPVRGGEKMHEPAIKKSNAPTIMLVDDSTYQLDMLTDCLRSEFNLLRACSAKECLEKLKENPAAVTAVVTDYDMPETDGITLCKNIQRIGRDRIPVLILSGCMKDADKTRALENGAQACLDKPCSAEELISMLKKIIHAKTLH